MAYNRRRESRKTSIHRLLSVLNYFLGQFIISTFKGPQNPLPKKIYNMCFIGLEHVSDYFRFLKKNIGEQFFWIWKNFRTFFF